MANPVPARLLYQTPADIWAGVWRSRRWRPKIPISLHPTAEMLAFKGNTNFRRNTCFW